MGPLPKFATFLWPKTREFWSRSSLLQRLHRLDLLSCHLPPCRWHCGTYAPCRAWLVFFLRFIGQPVPCTHIIYIYNPTIDLFLGGLTFHFMGQTFQNMGHLGSRCIYIYMFIHNHIIYIYIYLFIQYISISYLRIQTKKHDKGPVFSVSSPKNMGQTTPTDMKVVGSNISYSCIIELAITWARVWTPCIGDGHPTFNRESW